MTTDEQKAAKIVELLTKAGATDVSVGEYLISFTLDGYEVLFAPWGDVFGASGITFDVEEK